MANRQEYAGNRFAAWGDSDLATFVARGECSMKNEESRDSLAIFGGYCYRRPGIKNEHVCDHCLARVEQERRLGIENPNAQLAKLVIAAAEKGRRKWHAR